MQKTFAFAVAALGLVLSTPAAAQSLVGATVEVTARFPTDTAIFTNPGPVVVSDTLLEYPAGTYPSYNPSWQVDVFGNYITITDTLSQGLPFQTADFNGFVLAVISGPGITSASVDGSSTIIPLSTYLSGGSLFMNFSGVSTQAGGTARINFSTVTGAVPEISTWAMMLLGFGAVGFSMRRARKTKPTILAAA